MSIHLSRHMSIHVSIHIPMHMSTHMSINMCIRMSIHISVQWIRKDEHVVEYRSFEYRSNSIDGSLHMV